MLPSTTPVFVSVSEPAARAIPKSTTLTRPSGSSITFPGLMSRWIRPRVWAAASARAMSTATATASAGGIGPSRWSRSASVSPSTSSVTMKWVPSSDPLSNTATTFGWLNPAAARASRRNRSTNSRSRSNGGAKTLIATWRPSCRSSPWWTRAIPPWPSTGPSSYRSARTCPSTPLVCCTDLGLPTGPRPHAWRLAGRPARPPVPLPSPTPENPPLEVLARRHPAESTFEGRAPPVRKGAGAPRASGRCRPPSTGS